MIMIMIIIIMTRTKAGVNLNKPHDQVHFPTENSNKTSSRFKYLS